jgi:hypothetical protein
MVILNDTVCGMQIDAFDLNLFRLNPPSSSFVVRNQVESGSCIDKPTRRAKFAPEPAQAGSAPRSFVPEFAEFQSEQLSLFLRIFEAMCRAEVPWLNGGL